MPPLLPTSLDPTWRDHNERPKLNHSSTRSKSRIQSTQCNLQCPSPIPAATYSQQAITECPSHINARNHMGHYLLKNEPASISEADHGLPVTSSPVKLDHSPPPLLSPIHWAGKVWESDYNARDNHGYQPGTTLNHRRRPASCFPHLPTTLPYHEFMTLKSHPMTTLRSQQHTVTQLRTPCVHVFTSRYSTVSTCR
jgi:hypothetical protein